MEWLRLMAAVAWLLIFVIRPQLTLAVSLLVGGGAVIAMNAMVFWLTLVRRDHASSVVPLVGGALAAAGVALLPFTGSWHWAWLPLLIDWGGLPRFLAALYWELPR
jgi:hypothetical protein